MYTLPLLLTAATIVIAALAFLEARLKGRIFLVVIMVSTFLLPRIFPSIAMTTVCFAGRILIAVGCLVYLKWQGGLFSR